MVTGDFDGTEAPAAVQLQAMNGVKEAIDRGQAQPVAVMVRGPRLDYNNARKEKELFGQYYGTANAQSGYVLLFAGAAHGHVPIAPDAPRPGVYSLYRNIYAGTYVHEAAHARFLGDVGKEARAAALIAKVPRAELGKHISVYGAFSHPRELVAETHALRQFGGAAETAIAKAIAKYILDGEGNIDDIGFSA